MESDGGMEEEAKKRNTDCVYFLASPLTCKKGSECDYRHSEGARVNPRDCWYWLNGNCLNPKCSFRHPPLDDLFGTPTTSGLAPSSQAAISAEIPASHVPASNINKQSVPCYYFQKGNCLKGDKCVYIHGTPAARIAVPQQVVKFSTSLAETPKMQKFSWSTKETKQQNTPTHSAPTSSSDKPNIYNPMVNVKPKEVPLTSAKSLFKDVHMSNNVSSMLSSSTDDIPRFGHIHLPVGSAYVQNKLKDQFQPLDDQLLNGREAGEFLRPSSPGYVLLDNAEDSRRLHGQAVKGGQSLNSRDDYENHTDYEGNGKYEKERYSGMDDYNRLGQTHDGSGCEQRRISSNRSLGRSSLSDRRLLQKETSHDEIDRSDLRHQLLKQRRLNSSRLAVSPDGPAKQYQRGSNYMEERIHSHHAHVDRRQNSQESCISTRLKGRIVLPGRSSPDKVDMQTGKRRDVGRPQGRLSPVRPAEFLMKHQEKIRHRLNEELTTGARSLINKPTKKDDVESLDFAGPKSLAELKGAKVIESSQDHSTRSTIPASVMSDSMKTELRESESSLPFDSPKPLSVILKRKREEDPGSSASHNSDLQFILPVEDKGDNANVSNIVEDKVGSIDDEEEEEEEEEGLIPTEGENVIYDDQSPGIEDIPIPVTEGAMDVDAMEDQEVVHYDLRGESDYEAVDGGDYGIEDKNAYQEEEDELDDEDDFAKKVGAMFS